MSYHVIILSNSEANLRNHLWDGVEDGVIDLIEGVSINYERHSVFITPPVADEEDLHRLKWLIGREFGNKTRVIQVVKALL